MKKLLIFDAFSGAGGCAMGYHHAGFDVVGMDVEPMPRYPNVDLAPMNGVMLCGTMFGLRVRRHRIFESNLPLMAPGNSCRHRDGDLTVFGNCVQVCGSRGPAYVARSGRTHYRPLRVRTKQGAEAMGCEWMKRDELSESVPPAYTFFIGRQLRRVLEATLCPPD